MGVLVVFVVIVQMLVHERVMDVLVLVPLGEMKPDAQQHQDATGDKTDREWFSQGDD